MRLFVPGVLGLALFAVWVYAILDIISTEEALIRNLPKAAWLMLVIFVPGVGAIAWLAVGRPLNAGWAPGDTRVRQRRTYLAPEDRDDWRPPPTRPSEPRRSAAEEEERERRLREWEADLERRERELGDDG